MTISYFFIHKHNVLSAKVVCPKCKEVGNLVLRSSYPLKTFQITHSESTKIRKCKFGWTNEYYEELMKIYRKLEERRNEGVLV